MLHPAWHVAWLLHSWSSVNSCWNIEKHGTKEGREVGRPNEIANFINIINKFIWQMPQSLWKFSLVAPELFQKTIIHQNCSSMTVVVVVQSPSHVWFFVTLTATHQASLSLIISLNLAKFMSFVSVMSCSHLILWCPLLLLPSVFPRIRDFSN